MSTWLGWIWSTPFMTVKVIGRIHIEALRLWRRGAPLFRKPSAPRRESATGRGAIDAAPEQSA